MAEKWASAPVVGKWQGAPIVGTGQAESGGIGDTISQVLTGVNKPLGDLLSAPSAVIDVVGDLTGAYEPFAFEPTRQLWSDLFESGPPATSGDRIAQSAGELIGSTLPLTGLTMKASQIGREVARVAPSIAETFMGLFRHPVQTAKSVGAAIGESVAAHPYKTVAADVLGAGGAGVGEQQVEESGGDAGWQMAGGIAGGAAPMLPSVVASLLGKTLPGMVARKATEVGTRFLGSTEGAVGREAERTAWANREGVYADPGARLPGAEPLTVKKAITKPVTAVKDAVTGWTDSMALERESRMRQAAQSWLDERITSPEAQAGRAQAADLREKIPDFDPTIPQQTGVPSLVRGQESLERGLAGQELDTAVTRADKSAGAIRAFAEGQAPAGGADIPAEAQARVAAIQAKLRTAGLQVQGEIAAKGQALPAVGKDAGFDPLKAGEDLRTIRGTEKEKYKAEIDRLKGEIDQTARIPVEDLRAKLQGDIDALKTEAQPDVAVPPLVKALFGKQEVDEAGEAIEMAGDLDFRSLDKLRSDILDEMRNAQAGKSTHGSAQDIRLYKAAVARIDEALEADPGIKDAYKKFTEYYKNEFVPRFKEGVGGQMERVDSTLAPKIASEDLLPKFFGPNNITEAKQWNLIYGKDEAAQKIAIDRALSEIREGASVGGELDPLKLEKSWQSFVGKNARVMEEMPYVKKAVADADPRELFKRMGELEVQERALADNVLVKALGGKTDLIDQALVDPKLMRQLKTSFAGDAKASSSLARAVWDRAIKAGGENTLLDAKAMKAFIDKNDASLKVALSSDHLDDLRTVIDAAEMQGRTKPIAGQVESVGTPFDKLQEATGTGFNQFLSRIFAAQSGRTSYRYTVAGDILPRMVRQLTMKDAERLWKEALYNPRIANDIAWMARSSKPAPIRFQRLMNYLAVLPGEVGDDE